MGVADVMDLLYPKMMPIHTLTPDAMQPDEQGRIRLPRLMRCSYARMEPHGAYLIRELSVFASNLDLIARPFSDTFHINQKMVILRLSGSVKRSRRRLYTIYMQ
jgi:hypothetical protein